jgi:uncharacterized protein (TIGR02301 family)
VRRRLLAGCVAAALITLPLAWPVATPASAQQAQRPARPPPAPTPPPPAPEPPPPVYEPDLLKLAEVMGSLAFLRDLCAYPDAATWRIRMGELIEAEAQTTTRRERMAGAYNRGFNGFALTYRRCTPAAREATLRLVRDGERLTRRLAARFGG